MKVEAFFHLAANIAYLLMVPLSISILPVVLMRRDMDWGQMFIYDVPLFLMATASVSAFYIVSQKELYSNWTNTFKYLPLLMGLGIGLSVNNSFAVLEALMQQGIGIRAHAQVRHREEERQLGVQEIQGQQEPLDHRWSNLPSASISPSP